MITYKKNIVPNDFILGCSGGVDSVAAAHFLMKGDKRFSLFHFNHKLRPQNDLMEKTVIQFATDFGLILRIFTAVDFPISQEGSLESCAREARLKAIGNLLVDSNTVVLCHHLDDAIESYLMKCFCGTLHENFLPIQTKLNNGKTLLRPFLQTPKSKFIEYAQRNNLDKYIVEDETNKDTKIRRNFIRHKVLPIVNEEYGLRKVVLKKIIWQYKKCYSVN